MSLAERSTRAALFLGASTFATVFVGFLGGIVLARLLDPDYFGTFALAMTLYALLDVRSKMLLEQKYLRDQDSRPEYLDVFFALNMGLAAVSFCLLLVTSVGAVILNRPDLAICLGVIGIASLLDAVSSTIRWSIEKQVAFKAVSLIQALANVSQFLSSLIAALLGFGLWSLLLGVGVGAFVNLSLFLRIAPQRPKLGWNHSLAREFLAYGTKYGLALSISSVVLTQFDNFIVGLLGGTVVLGFYDRARRTAMWPTLFVSPILGRISLPTYSKLQDDPARLGKAFSMVLWTVLTVTTPTALLFLATAPELVAVMYGDKWLPSALILQILAAFAIFRPLWDNLISALVATERSHQMARIAFIQAITLIVLIVPLTWFFGGAGAAVSVGLAFMMSAGFLLYFGRTYLKISLMDSVGWPMLNNALTLAGYVALRLILPIGELPLLLRLLSETGLMLGLYALVSLIVSGRIVRQRLQYIYQLARGG
jgi:O-antigen/teichoic acid export membrane protein